MSEADQANAHVDFRVQDMNNLYRVVLTSGGAVVLQKMVNGSASNIGTGQTWTPSTATVKIKASGTTLTVWVAGTQSYSLTDSSIAAGGVALGGESAKFDNFKVGYDVTGNNSLGDAGDNVFANETFASTSTTASSDHAGSLIADRSFVYIYDALALDSLPKPKGARRSRGNVAIKCSIFLRRVLPFLNDSSLWRAASSVSHSSK